MITNHQYIDKYPISQESKKLIVGTIHPHNHEKFIVPFFYGNELSIWNILNKAFDNEMDNDITLKSILIFLSNHKISISDTIRVCERKSLTALDKDLNPLELNNNLVEQIRNSNIDEILFTSGFGKNNAFKLFYSDLLHQKITPEIRNNREVLLDKNIFGRMIKLTVLYSPSGTSNIGISKSEAYLENAHKYTHSRTPVKDFKIDYYKEKFR